MVQLRLSVLFILAAAAIAPVVALPIPGSDGTGAAGSSKRQSLAPQYKDGRDPPTDGHNPGGTPHASKSSNLGKPAGPRAMPESQRPRNPIWQPSAPQSRPSTPPNHQGPPPELQDGKGLSKEKADKAARRIVVINEPKQKGKP